MKQDFKIFVINLPKDADRREFMERQLTAMGGEFEIAPGIYGDDERVSLRYDEALAIKEHGKPLIFGEKGCALAHALVHEKIVKESIPYALILEDDMVLPKNFLSLVQQEIEKGPSYDWLSFDYRYVGLQFLVKWFEATWVTIKARPLFFFYAILKMPYMIVLSCAEGLRDYCAQRFKLCRGPRRFYRPLYNAGAYILTLSGAKKLLPFTTPLRLTADQLPNVARVKTNFTMRGYVPLITRQNLETFGTNAGKTEEEWRDIKR